MNYLLFVFPPKRGTVPGERASAAAQQAKAQGPPRAARQASQQLSAAGLVDGGERQGAEQHGRQLREPALVIGDEWSFIYILL